MLRLHIEVSRLTRGTQGRGIQECLGFVSDDTGFFLPESREARHAWASHGLEGLEPALQHGNRRLSFESS